MKRHLLILSRTLSLSLSLLLPMAAGTAFGEEVLIQSSVGRDETRLFAGARVAGVPEARSETRVRPGFARNVVVARDHERNLHLGVSYMVEHLDWSMGGHFSQGAVDDETYLNHVQFESVGDLPRIDLRGGASTQSGSLRSQHDLSLRMRTGESWTRSESRVER